MNEQLCARFARLQLVAFDIDGVFTDGRFLLSDDGVESKAFHTQDGYGLRRLIEADLHVAVISGRRSRAVEWRMAELGVEQVHLGCGDKLVVFENLLETLGVAAEAAAFVGDDLPDLPVLRAAGVAVAVANAHPDIAAACDWTTGRDGGNGAVREVCDTVLLAKGRSPVS